MVIPRFLFESFSQHGKMKKEKYFHTLSSLMMDVVKWESPDGYTKQGFGLGVCPKAWETYTTLYIHVFFMQFKVVLRCHMQLLVSLILFRFEFSRTTVNQRVGMNLMVELYWSLSLPRWISAKVYCWKCCRTVKQF